MSPACLHCHSGLTHQSQFPITALREIKLLKTLSHVNVLTLTKMAIERPTTSKDNRKKATLYMVTPYMSHDLSGLLDNPAVQLSEAHIKCYMVQLLRGLQYLHNSHILHRDMKAANLLIGNNGILQIADFGLARQYDGDVPRPGKGGGEATRDYTALVVTRWYRPPELLLQLRQYTTAIDMWGAGCVFGEMFKRKPILDGKSDLHQASLIFELVGSPTDETMPGWNTLPGAAEVAQYPQRSGKLETEFREQGSSAISLLRELLKLDWRKRINAVDALEHPYFKNDPKPARPEDLPRFPDSHELDRRNARGQKQALPPAPAGGTVGGGPNGEWNGQGPPQNWQNGNDRHHGGRPGPAWDRERGGGRNDRRPPRDGHGPTSRGSHLPPPPSEGARHPLPPAPHLAAARDGGRRDGGGGRDGGRDGGGRGASNIDTYIPKYDDGPRRRSRDLDTNDLPPHDRYRERRDNRDTDAPPPRQQRRYDDLDELPRGGEREYDRAPPRRDYDRPPPNRDHRVPRDDRGAPRRTRSRSPERDRDRNRDTQRDNRDVYRR